MEIINDLMVPLGYVPLYPPLRPGPYTGGLLFTVMLASPADYDKSYFMVFLPTRPL